MKREISYTSSESDGDIGSNSPDTSPSNSEPSTPTKKAKVVKPKVPKTPKAGTGSDSPPRKNLSESNGTWTPELKVSVIELLLDRGKASVEMSELTTLTGLSKTQLSTALQKGNPSNLRAQVLRAVGQLGSRPTKD